MQKDPLSIRTVHLRVPGFPGILACFGLISPIPAPAGPTHLTITEYNGPATCVACHPSEASDAFHSVHYQLTGPTPYATNIPGNAGKYESGLNTYCGTVLSSRSFTCRACHAGYGGTPSETLSNDQLNNIDCLICHQDQYKRKPAPPFESVTFTDYLGTQRTWQLPIEDAAGSFRFQPDAANMTITPLEAARTVHRPTRASCLRCHATAGGSDYAKRGDLGMVTADPPPTVDVHMSSQRGNLSCTACHEVENHRFMGRGLDLRESDRTGMMTCTQCHPSAPHASATTNRHTPHVACQTCHIPTYAKAGTTTEIERNWNQPVWAGGLLGGQGGFKPEEIRAANLIPSYRWYDGTSQVYVLGQSPPQNADGEYELGLPNGTVAGHQAQIMPMKEHRGNSARHDATGQLIPHSTFKYFVTGDFDQAVADGMAYTGLSGNWSTVRVHTYQTINHEVVDSTGALSCGECHAEYSAGNPVRMDLKGKLGYAIKGPVDTVCQQCHGPKTMPRFSSLHQKHVTSKLYDCAWCHNFTRPERDLKIPPSQDADNDKVVDTFDNCPSKPNTDQANADRDAYGDLCDNCPDVSDPDQTDSDGDGIGDVCDRCPDAASSGQVDATGCPVRIPGDFDGDGDVDGNDLDRFEACATGPAIGYNAGNLPTGCTLVSDPPGRIAADFDDDGDTDQSDFAVLQRCLSGEDIPGKPDCAG